MNFKRLLVALVCSSALWSAASAGEGPKGYAENAYRLVWLPKDQRERFRNPDGSCVQCSLSMVGVAMNCPAAEWLLWDSPYGPRIRGGSNPDRVKAYCDGRGIRAWNVTGRSTMDWVVWALSTGRPCAITWGSDHMIAALGITADGALIGVCDNNTPWKIDWIPRQRFIAMHAQFGGGWVVVLQGPPPAGRYVYYPWWE